MKETRCDGKFQVRSLESQLYPERIREITQQVQLQYQHQEVLEPSAPTVTVTTSQRCRSESQPPLPAQTATQPVSVALLQETAAAVAQLQVRVLQNGQHLHLKAYKNSSYHIVFMVFTIKTMW